MWCQKLLLWFVWRYTECTAWCHVRVGIPLSLQMELTPKRNIKRKWFISVLRFIDQRGRPKGEKSGMKLWNSITMVSTILDASTTENTNWGSHFLHRISPVTFPHSTSFRKKVEILPFSGQRKWTISPTSEEFPSLFMNLKNLPPFPFREIKIHYFMIIYWLVWGKTSMRLEPKAIQFYLSLLLWFKMKPGCVQMITVSKGLTSIGSCRTSCLRVGENITFFKKDAEWHW